MTLLRNIGVLAVCPQSGGQAEIDALRDAALVWEDSVVTWVGPEAELPRRHRDHDEVVDAGGKLVVPGLIDCHTHLVFGGWRADEFEQRIQGRSYLDIANAGGGILETVESTRAASDEELLDRGRRWLAQMAQLGVTTAEVKSGYGLDWDTELRVLDVYRRLQVDQPLYLVPTLLAAHVVPREYRANREGYVIFLREQLIPEVAARGLARFCDVFVEESAFTADEARAILGAGLAHGLRGKVHADQLTDTGGAALAAEVQAISADHLECISQAGITLLAASDVVAVSLPIASLYLNRAALPARALIAAGVPVAVATDFNPGSAPTCHLPLAMLLACTLQRMTPREVLKGVTAYAARAIGEQTRRGSLEAGKQADLAIIDAPDVNHWLYHFAANRCVATYIAGERVC